jgi:hypothetical protein
MIDTLITDNVATKSDLVEVKADLKEAKADLKAEIASLKVWLIMAMVAVAGFAISLDKLLK